MGDEVPAASSSPVSSSPGEERTDRFLRLVGIVAGLALVGFLFAPVGHDNAFVWDILRGRSTTDVDVMRWFYPAAMGLLVAIVGFIRLPAVARAGGYALLGLVPSFYFVVRAHFLLEDGSYLAALPGSATPAAAAAAELPWRFQLLLVALYLLPIGLLLRARPRWPVVSRVLMALGIAGIAGAYLFPLSSLSGSSALPVVALFEGFGAVHPLGVVVAAALALPLALALLSLPTFAGQKPWSGTSLVAKLFFFWLPLTGLTYVAYSAVLASSSANPVEIVRLLLFGFVCQVFVVFGLVRLSSGIGGERRREERA